MAKEKKTKVKKKKIKEVQYVPSMLNNPVLDYKVYVPGKAEAIFVRICLLLAGGCVSLVFYGGLFKSDGEGTTATMISNLFFFVVVGLLTGRFFMPLYKERKKQKRQEQLRIQFKNMLESLSASFSAGNNVQDAFIAALNDLSAQYAPTDYIIVEMQEIVNGVMSNLHIEAIIKFWGERSGSEDIETFANVFGICYRKGGDMKKVVKRTYTVISDKMAINDEIETKLTSNKMQHNAMSLMPIVLVILLRLLNPAMAENFATLQGVIVNTIAIGMFIGAYKYGQKIVDIKE